MDIAEAMQSIDEANAGRRMKKIGLTHAESLALVALRPFLGAIGGRIAMMLDVAIQSENTGTETEDANTRPGDQP